MTLEAVIGYRNFGEWYQNLWGHEFDLSGSRDVISHV